MAINTENGRIIIRSILLRNDFPITDTQLDLLHSYRDLLIGWNKKINLVSRRDEENIWMQHILLSISFLLYISIYKDALVLDLGTGGGLPGIPLSIMCPGARFVLLDSIRKKCDAVRQMIGELHLHNATVECGRAEDYTSSKNFSGTFDAVIARSVAPLDRLMTWSYPLLKKNNTMDFINLKRVYHVDPSKPTLVTLKGGELSEELDHAKIIFSQARIETTPLIFNGSEELQNQDKKVIFVQFH